MIRRHGNVKAWAGTEIAPFARLAPINGGAAGDRPQAQGNLAEQLRQIPTQRQGAFDIAAATAFARTNWNLNIGYCAEFCFRVLRAGGFIIDGWNNRHRAYTQYNHLVNELGFNSFFLGNGRVTRNAERIEEGDMVMWDKSHRLRGISSEIVSITGSGGHIVYISEANGPRSRFCGRNPAQRDALLVTGGGHGMWLIKTSELSANERLDVRSIAPTEFEVRVSGNIRKSPNGTFHIGHDARRLTTTPGDIVTIDMTCRAGTHTWGRIVNDGWDWIAISHGRATEVAPPNNEAWTGNVRILTSGNVRSSPNGEFYYRLLVSDNVRAWPNGDVRVGATTKAGEIVSIAGSRRAGEWRWGRLDHGVWDWVALERRDGSGRRFEFVTTTRGETFTIAEQEVAGEWVWGRIDGTNAWIAVENLRTGATRCERMS